MTYGGAEIFFIPFVTIGNFLDYSDKQIKINHIYLYLVFHGYRFFGTGTPVASSGVYDISVPMLLSIELGAVKIYGSSMIC